MRFSIRMATDRPTERQAEVSNQRAEQAFEGELLELLEWSSVAALLRRRGPPTLTNSRVAWKFVGAASGGRKCSHVRNIRVKLPRSVFSMKGP